MFNTADVEKSGNKTARCRGGDRQRIETLITKRNVELPSNT